MRQDIYKWLVVAMLWLVCVFNYADRQAINSVLDPIGKEMRLDDIKLGIISGAFMWVYAAALPFAGLIGDRYSRKLLILGGLFFWSVVTLLTAFCSNYPQLVLCRGLEGLGESVYFPASMSLLSDYHGPKTRSRAMAWHQSSVYSGTILGGWAAGYLAQRYGWRSGFVLFGSLGVLLGIVLIVTLKEPMRERKSSIDELAPDVRRDVAWLLRQPMFLLLAAVFAGANFVAAIFLTWMPTYFGRKFHMDLTMAGLNGTAWAQISMIVGVLIGGTLADRWVLRSKPGRMYVQSLGLLCGVPFLFLTGWTQFVLVLVLALVGFGFCKGLYDANIWASLYDVVPPSMRSTALGLMNSTAWLSGGAGTVLVGKMSSKYGMSTSLTATSVVYFAIGSTLLVAARSWGQRAKVLNDQSQWSD